MIEILFIFLAQDPDCRGPKPGLCQRSNGASDADWMTKTSIVKPWWVDLKMLDLSRKMAHPRFIYIYMPMGTSMINYKTWSIMRCWCFLLNKAIWLIQFSRPMAKGKTEDWGGPGASVLFLSGHVSAQLGFTWRSLWKGSSRAFSASSWSRLWSTAPHSRAK